MQISAGRILIFVLTFAIYAYSGFGLGILTNLRDAIISAESVFGDVLQNVMNVAKKFKKFSDVFDVAVEEECIFKCATEGVTPVPDRYHTPSSDGCGSLGLEIKSEYFPIGAMTKCCDQHDICYDTCQANKELCDIEFRRCLYKYCDTHKKLLGEVIVKACKATAKLLFTGTLTLGCKSYLNAQKKACYCPSYGWKDSRNYKYTRGNEEL